MKLPSIFLFFWFALTPAHAQVTPQLYLAPAPVFDQECAARTGFKPRAEIQQQLWADLARFQAGWDREAVTLIPASESVAGRKFSRKEYSVALTTCAWTPMGDPALIINMNAFLGPKAAPMPVFVSMLHHELLHSLVDNLITLEFSDSSALIEKYKDENYIVLVHLHLMAIQKAAYESLGREDLVRETDRLYLELIGGHYQRAWEIVKAEGTKPFLDEARAFNARKR